MRDECEHGRLRRACPECHAAEDIAELNAELDALRAHITELEGIHADQLDGWKEENARLAADAANEKAERESWQALAGKYRKALEAAPNPAWGPVEYERWFQTTRAEALD